MERALELVARLPRDQAEAVLLRVVVGLDGTRRRPCPRQAPGRGPHRRPPWPQAPGAAARRRRSLGVTPNDPWTPRDSGLRASEAVDRGRAGAGRGLGGDGLPLDVLLAFAVGCSRRSGGRGRSSPRTGRSRGRAQGARTRWRDDWRPREQRRPGRKFKESQKADGNGRGRHPPQERPRPSRGTGRAATRPPTAPRLRFLSHLAVSPVSCILY